MDYKLHFEIFTRNFILAQAMMQKRLLDQSRELFLARQKVTCEVSGTNENNNRSTSSHSKSALSAILRSIEEKVKNKKQQSGSKIPKSTPQVQQHHVPLHHIPLQHVTPASIQSSQPSTKDSEVCWDDELDNLKPPSLSIGSTMYGVSDGGRTESESIPSQDSHDELCQQMANSLLVDEPLVTSEIKDLVEEINVGDLFPVEVLEVNSPLKFWAQILHTKYGDQRKELSKKMR